MSEPVPGDRTVQLNPPDAAAARPGEEPMTDAGQTRIDTAGPAVDAGADTDPIGRLRLEQRRRWQHGERLRVEDYLAREPSLRADEDAVLDLLFRELLLREETGEAPPVEELVRRFPHLEPRIRQQFALHAALHTRPGFRGEPAPARDAPERTLGIDPHRTDAPEGPVKPPSETPDDLAEKSRFSIAGYEVLGELGRGGMGVVYKARQVRLNRVVALKMILSGAHAGTMELDRFRSEAEAAARVQHPNLVQIYEVGEFDGRPFFSLEFVDGPSLADVIGGKPRPWRHAAEMVETLARAVHAIHERGLIHRDLKPANVLLTSAGVPKITDFGLAKNLDGGGLTATGDILGTPIYMAPEQAAGKVHDIGTHTDVYALGVILYEMLTGRPPFLAAMSIEIVRQVIADEPLSPSRLQPKVPRDLVTICLKCLEKDPKKRYSSALALADDLRRSLDGEPIQARPVSRAQRLVKWARRRPALAALLGVSALAVLALLVGGWVYNARLQQALALAEEKGEESRQLLVRLNVADGARLLDEGNWFGALVWFTQAMRRDEGRPEREAMHRIRLGSVLERCPTQAQLWFHEGAVQAARFSPDGRRVVTASADGTARVWDTATGAAVGRPLTHDGPVLGAEFSADGRKVVTASADGTARLWEADSGRVLAPPLKPGRPLTCARFSPDGTRVVTADEGPTARLWDAAGHPLGVSFRHEGAVRWAAFSPDGKWLVTASEDGTGRVWDAQTGKPRTPPLKHAAGLTYAVFSPDGTAVLTCSLDHTACLWDAATGKELARPLRHGRAVQHGSFSPDGKQVVTASNDRAAQIWSTATGERVAPSLRHSSDVNQAHFSSDGKWVVTAADDNTARLWDARTGELLPPWLLHTGSVNGAAFSPDGRHVLSYSTDTVVRLCDVSAITARAPVKDGDSDFAGPLPVPVRADVKALSPDGKWLVRAEAGNQARVVDARTGAPVGQPLRHGSEVLFVTFSPHGRRVGTGSDDNTARLWDAATGRLLAPPLRHAGSVRHVAFSPDGLLAATASEDETARVWDASTGEPLTPPLQHRTAVKTVAFSPDGRRLQTTTFDGVHKTWELGRDDRPVAELVRLAEVLAASRIDADRGYLPLGAERLKKLWEETRTGQIPNSK